MQMCVRVPCARACARVRACARARACVRVCVCLGRWGCVGAQEGERALPAHRPEGPACRAGAVRRAVSAARRADARGRGGHLAPHAVCAAKVQAEQGVGLAADELGHLAASGGAGFVSCRRGTRSGAPVEERIPVLDCGSASTPGLFGCPRLRGSDLRAMGDWGNGKCATQLSEGDSRNQIILIFAKGDGYHLIQQNLVRILQTGGENALSVNCLHHQTLTNDSLIQEKEKYGTNLTSTISLHATWPDIAAGKPGRKLETNTCLPFQHNVFKAEQIEVTDFESAPSPIPIPPSAAMCSF